jgi:4-hydroxy-3-methylbut-2-enyl diphosphate reductase
MLTVDIDTNSGFCAGVIRAIGKAEDFLSSNTRLYSLGAIVHNDAELSRLTQMGLVTIDKEDLGEMVNAAGETLLIRAHGEPPQTYTLAEGLGFKIIDCTCPVVLQLQKKIKDAYELCKAGEGLGQIIIFGKTGHAEVLGLVGQTEGTAIVVENFIMLQEMIENGTIRLDAPTMVFSQTTKSPAEYAHVCASLLEKMAKSNGMTVENFKNSGRLLIHNTICSQVASRHQKLTKFALQHDIIIFVSGKASSNGKVLCDLCKSLNIRTYHITSASEIKRDWFRADDSVGVCGATSTPKWLLEEVANEILALNKYVPDWEKTYGEKSTDNQ